MDPGFDELELEPDVDPDPDQGCEGGSLRQVEYYRGWADGTWDTSFIEIPAATPYEELDAAVKTAAQWMLWEKAPVFVGLYHAGEQP